MSDKGNDNNSGGLLQHFKEWVGVGTTTITFLTAFIGLIKLIPGAGLIAQRFRRWIEIATTNSLISEGSVDYTQLDNLLKAKSWKDADYETYLVILRVIGCKEGNFIRKEELLNFSSTDLRIINNLWMKYSNQRFGFSVQKKIYLKVGGVPNYIFNEETWTKLSNRVGWNAKESSQDDASMSYNIMAPVGHLPTVYRLYPRFQESQGFGQERLKRRIVPSSIKDYPNEREIAIILLSHKDL